MKKFKKPIILIFSLLILGALSLFALQLIEKKGSSIAENIGFAIDDTTQITKIVISDPFSSKTTLVQSNNQWTNSNGECISKSNVSLILEAAKMIEFKGYLAKNAHKQFVKLMATQHTKVEFYVNGKWDKTWYIGPPTQDHNGQIMLLESAEEGKSTEPVMMRIKGFNGTIGARFFSDPKKWMCTKIFALDVNEIKSVDVNFIENPSINFNIKNKNGSFQVSTNGKKLPFIDTANVYRYLQGYKKIHFDYANFELNKKQCDSLKRSRPFCVLHVAENNGRNTKLKMYRIKTKEPQRNEFNEIVNMDMNLFWAVLPNGQVVKCQYFVFNPLLLGEVYFPSLSNLTLNK